MGTLLLELLTTSFERCEIEAATSVKLTKRIKEGILIRKDELYGIWKLDGPGKIITFSLEIS